MTTLTIIETGQVPKAISGKWPDYPAMFKTLLTPHMDDLTCETVALSSQQTLPDPANLEAILITGSPAGVYDQVSWLSPLFDFICAAATCKTPQIGICFGHQAIAYALGAKVGKSDKGWGIGRHEYRITHRPNWMADHTAPTFSLGVSHQDQVQSLPHSSRLVASNNFCAFAALDYPEAKAMSFQGHPEFSTEFNCALYNIRKGGAIPTALVDAAEHSLKTPVDNDLVGKWMAHFLTSHAQ